MKQMIESFFKIGELAISYTVKPLLANICKTKEKIEYSEHSQALDM